MIALKGVLTIENNEEIHYSLEKSNQPVPFRIQKFVDGSPVGQSEEILWSAWWEIGAQERQETILIPAWHEEHAQGFEVFTAEGLKVGSPSLMIVKTEEDALTLEKIVVLYSAAGISIEKAKAMYRFAYECVDHGNTSPRHRQNFEYQGVPRYEKLDEDGFLDYARKDIADLLAREEQANQYNQRLSVQVIEQQDTVVKVIHDVPAQNWVTRIIGRLRRIFV